MHSAKTPQRDMKIPLPKRLRSQAKRTCTNSDLPTPSPAASRRRCSSCKRGSAFGLADPLRPCCCCCCEVPPPLPGPSRSAAFTRSDSADGSLAPPPRPLGALFIVKGSVGEFEWPGGRGVGNFIVYLFNKSRELFVVRVRRRTRMFLWPLPIATQQDGVRGLSLRSLNVLCGAVRSVVKEVGSHNSHNYTACDHK